MDENKKVFSPSRHFFETWVTTGRGWRACDGINEAHESGVPSCASCTPLGCAKKNKTPKQMEAARKKHTAGFYVAGGWREGSRKRKTMHPMRWYTYQRMEKHREACSEFLTFLEAIFEEVERLDPVFAQRVLAVREDFWRLNGDYLDDIYDGRHFGWLTAMLKKLAPSSATFMEPKWHTDVHDIIFSLHIWVPREYMKCNSSVKELHFKDGVMQVGPFQLVVFDTTTPHYSPPSEGVPKDSYSITLYSSNKAFP